MYVWVVLQICVITNALHTLCVSVYHYDRLYICKDLTEGEINKSINQSINAFMAWAGTVHLFTFTANSLRDFGC